MSAQFWRCPGCSRHIRRRDASCPFCSAPGWLKVLDTTGSSTPQGVSLAFTVPPIAAPFPQAGGPFYVCVTAPGAPGAIVSLSGAPS
jgi:hypothetical protein